MVFDGRIWHGTGENRSDDPREMIFAYYCRPFVRQQETFTLSLAPEVMAKCSPELLNLLGFNGWNALGMTEGPNFQTLRARPDRFVTELG